MEKQERIDAIVLKDVVARSISLSWVFAVMFLLYGFTSFDFIQRFTPEVMLWQNVWPRLVFSSFPFVVTALYLKRSRISDRTKLIVWITAFSTILLATAWIEIWPIALWGSPQVLTYVNAANVYLYALIYSVVAPPRRYLTPFTLILLGIFVIPLLVVSYRAGDFVVFKLVLNDTGVSLGFSIILSSLIDRLRNQIAVLKFEKESEAAKFLGPVLSKAIFDDEKRHLERVRCRGFVVSIDVRDSTTLQQVHKERWLEFRREYFALAAQLVKRHGGYIQKTVGDCHLVNFGVMDYGVDLSDIPGIEAELARAEDHKLQRAGDAAFNFVYELFSGVDRLSRDRFSDRPVFLGAGIDKGWVERSIQGDSSHQLELDVNGDPVNCCSRLQEYSKVVFTGLGGEGSVLVASPFATDYLRDTNPFIRLSTIEKPVRNYPGIKWILVYRHGSSAAGSGSSRAA